MALRTVPAVLKYGKKKILVNCFLDEGSNTTYVNEDVVEELGVKGEKELITVNVANDQGPVVQRLDNAIHLINHYPVDSVVCFVNTYPLDSDLSGG